MTPVKQSYLPIIATLFVKSKSILLLHEPSVSTCKTGFPIELILTIEKLPLLTISYLAKMILKDFAVLCASWILLLCYKMSIFYRLALSKRPPCWKIGKIEKLLS